MANCVAKRSWSKFLPVALMVGCSSSPAISAREAADAADVGATLAAKSDTERKLLTQLSGIPSDGPQQIGDGTIVAEAAYVAASGRTCRAVHVTSNHTKTTSHRLACNDGKAWFFVPDVFEPSSAGTPE